MDFSSLFDWQKIVWGLGCGLAGWLLALFRNKTKVLPYYVTHHRVGVTANDNLFGNVKVMLDEAVVSNLWLTEIRLDNISLTDFENVVINAYSGDSRMINSSARIDGTSEGLFPTQQFKSLIEVKPGESPTQAQRAVYWGQREYIIPVFNRGKSAIIQILTSAHANNGTPSVWLDVKNKGVKGKYLRLAATVDVIRIKGAVIWGIGSSVPLIVGLWFASGRMGFWIFGAYLVGLGSGFIGLACRWIVSKFRHLIAM